MNFKEAFLKLIKQSHLTTQEIATKLKVPISTIKSWENGSSEPNKEQLLQINQLFNGELECLVNPSLSNKKEILNQEEIQRFFSAKKSSTNLMATGVSLSIISAIPILIGVSNPTSTTPNLNLGLGIILCLLLVAVAVGFFIYSDAIIKPFATLKTNSFLLSKTEKASLESAEKKNYLRSTKKLAIGISLCIISAIPLFAGIFFPSHNSNQLILLMVSVALLIISVGVNMIIKAKSEKETYNILLQKGDYSPSMKNLQGSLELFNSIFWGIITIFYLGSSFLSHRWEITWLIWPFAGIIYAIIEKIFKVKKEV